MVCLACFKPIRSLNNDFLCNECARWTQMCSRCQQPRSIFNSTCECEITHPEIACAFCEANHTFGRTSTIWNGKICLVCVEKFSRCNLCNARLNINQLCDCTKQTKIQEPARQEIDIWTQRKPLPNGRSFGFMFHPLNGRNAFSLAGTVSTLEVTVQMTDKVKDAIRAEIDSLIGSGIQERIATSQTAQEIGMGAHELQQILSL